MAIPIYSGTGFTAVPVFGTDGYEYDLSILGPTGQPANIWRSYYAGSFFIDTGYNDPYDWTVAYPIQEMYAGRAYAVEPPHYPPIGLDNTECFRTRIEATPVWSLNHFTNNPEGSGNPPTSGTVINRIWLKCDVWFYNVTSIYNVSGCQLMVPGVNWQLYRI